MFDIEPKDIADFDGEKTVALLRRLLYAEAQNAGIEPFNVAAPMQITLADEGEDGSVVWKGGKAKTAYFPHRDIIFQCKASDNGDSAWMKETWTKKSARGRTTPRVLNGALTAGLARGAAYIGVTTDGLVNPKPSDRIKAIEAGITQAGHNPRLLHSIKLYDGNLLAKWASSHEAVALWIKEQQAGMTLSSFSSLDRWRAREGSDAPGYVAGDSARFRIGASSSDGLTFEQFSGRLVSHLRDPSGRSVRIIGSSGVGKSRGAFEGLERIGLGKDRTSSSVIFCDRREVGHKLWDVSNALANRGTPIILFVDECPRADAHKLHDIASKAGSELRIITVDTNPRALTLSGCLEVRVEATDQNVIDGILAGLLPGSEPDDRRFIADLCAGFPSIAVLAARAHGKDGIFKSVEDVATRILKGAGLTDPDRVRALACLSMFDSLAPERTAPAFDAVAKKLGRLNGDAMYEHLIDAVEPGLVGRYGDVLAAQPRPIANYLALQRLERLRPSVVRDFLDTAPDAQRTAMLSRVRHLSRSGALRELVPLIFGTGGSLSDPAKVLTTRGAAFIDAFVHVAPGYVSGVIHNAVGATAIADLGTASGSLDGIVHALRRLVFRKSTFADGLRDLLRLAAAETCAAGPATETVRQLFQLHLSGTETSSAIRFQVLDEAVKDGDPDLRRVALAALDAALDFSHPMRIGGYEELGDELPAKDWRPKSNEEALGHLKAALTRLSKLRAEHPDFAEAAEQAVASHMRQLMIPGLFEAVTAFVREVRTDRGFWPEAVKGVGDWLYFDREDPKSDLALAVRRLYDDLLPVDPVERTLLFCQFWPAEIRDPDLIYTSDRASNDFQYAARQAALMAPVVAANSDLLDRAINLLASQPVRNASSFTDALAPLLNNPKAVFEQALTRSDASDGAGASFVQALLRSLDNRDAELGVELVAMAEASATFAGRDMLIFAAVRLTESRLTTVAERIASGSIGPEAAVPLSYGQGMDPFPVGVIRPVLDALIGRASEGGVWAAIEMLSMYTHGRTEFDDDVYQVIKEVLTTPFGQTREGGTMSAHSYGTLVSLLSRAGEIDDEFAGAFAKQIVIHAQSKASYRSTAGEALQEALETILKDAPEATWVPIAAFYDVATQAERARLDEVISKKRYFANPVDVFKEGALYAVPCATLTGWAAADPEKRIAFLVSFYPLLDLSQTLPAWHPALLGLASQFGETKAFQNALRRRISPSSWAGSLSAYLEPFFEPLAAWADHPSLGFWSHETRDILDRRLKADADLEASWR
ncbi:MULTISPECIES: hypothetical protein [unclassified Brevundimonas]|nr:MULTISPECIES: hypothetical protein [unclassified Brevundimonas]